MKIDRDYDIGYIFKGDNYLPIKPMKVDHRLVKDPTYKVKDKTKLFIHDEILKYYMATEFIKTSDNLQEYNRTHLYAALNNLGFTIMIRANYQLLLFLGNRVSKGSYQNINEVINTLNEPVTGIGYLDIIDGNVNCEQFPDLLAGIKILNTRYKDERKNKTK